MGTALGHSVRLRYEGADAADAARLDLDRQIALAASRLYRKVWPEGSGRTGRRRRGEKD
jgi:hypothetical protein